MAVYVCEYTGHTNVCMGDLYLGCVCGYIMGTFVHVWIGALCANNYTCACIIQGTLL